MSGDVNTDPWRLAGFAPSADRLPDGVGDGRPFAFVSDVGPGVTPTCGGAANIDHVLGDALRGDGVAHGATPGTAPLLDAVCVGPVPVVRDLQASTAAAHAGSSCRSSGTGCSPSTSER